MASIEHELTEKLVPVYVDYFYKNEGDERFWLIKGYVANMVLNNLYGRFVEGNEIERLEYLPKDKKEKYWQLAKLYCGDKEETYKIRARRSAYVLELITSTF